MTAAPGLILNPVNGDFEAIEGETSVVALARRLKRRRQTMALAAASHVVNVALLAIFALAGTITFTMVAIFAICATLSVAIFTALSESGISDRWKDHFLAGPYTAATCVLMLAFIYAVPAVAVVFLCAFFLIANVVALRASIRRGIAACAMITFGVVLLYGLADLPLALPAGSALERIGTLLTFASTVARIMFINIFASRMRDRLFRRGLELEEAYKRIEELAELDELTGALNRRSIMRTVESTAVRSRVTGLPCTIALIDLDLFKRINDNFGHLTGDEVLRTFAITIFANIRSDDRFGRYGGEEFLLILPDTPHDQAARIVERLRSIIEMLDWSALSETLNVTISAGVATLGPDESIECALARADIALYAAKERGRNRIAAA